MAHSKFMSVHSSAGLRSCGHHLPRLASTAEEGPVWPPHRAAVRQEVTGTGAAKCRHKEPGFTEVHRAAVEPGLEIRRCQAEECSSCLCRPEGKGFGGLYDHKGTRKRRSWGQEMRAWLTVLDMTKSHGNMEKALGFGWSDGWRARGRPERRNSSAWPEKISSQQFFLAGHGEGEHEEEAPWCAGGLLSRAGAC